MFDTTGTFERAFQPVEGGYLYYTSKWSSGYLVTEDEYQKLVADWREVAGAKSTWKLVGLIMIVIFGWTLISPSLALGERYSHYFSFALVPPIMMWLYWKASAVKRLIKHREPIAPPRSSKRAETDMGAILSWPMTIWMLVVVTSFCGWAFLWATTDPFLGIPAFIVTSVIAFFNFRIAFRKWQNRNNEGG